MREKSIHIQYRHNHQRFNSIVHVSKNGTFFPNIFNPWLVESSDVEPGGFRGPTVHTTLLDGHTGTRARVISSG